MAKQLLCPGVSWSNVAGKSLRAVHPYGLAYNRGIAIKSSYVNTSNLKYSIDSIGVKVLAVFGDPKTAIFPEFALGTNTKLSLCLLKVTIQW